MQLTPDLIRTALANDFWDLGNQVLYDLCSEHPRHDRADVIIAKVWLIGRSYSAAIERRKENQDNRGEIFYESNVAPSISSSEIDRWLDEIRNSPSADRKPALVAHGRLTELFRSITGLDKRSLASKYLHFHIPDRFYIFDQRAQAAARRLMPRVRVAREAIVPGSDPQYVRFSICCGEIRTEAKRISGRDISPRDLDKILLAVSATRSVV
jgi:hypothetical protein